MMPSEQIEQFSSNVEKLAQDNDLTYIEAVVEYCEQTEIEVEVRSQAAIYVPEGQDTERG